VYVFSALQETHEDAYTKRLIEGRQNKKGGGSWGFGGKVATTTPPTFVRIGKTLMHNRYEVTSRKIDVLVYLDVGMDPATIVWAQARLAPTQICLWGHPTTTGLASMDFFVSSYAFHNRIGSGGEGRGIGELEQGKGLTLALGTKSTRTNTHMYAHIDQFSEQLVMFESLGLSHTTHKDIL